MENTLATKEVKIYFTQGTDTWKRLQNLSSSNSDSNTTVITIGQESISLEEIVYQNVVQSLVAQIELYPQTTPSLLNSLCDFVN